MSILFRVCERRSGKTTWVARSAIEFALKSDNSRICIVMPNGSAYRNGIKPIFKSQLAEKSADVQSIESNNTFVFSNGSTIHFNFSTEMLRGSSFDKIFVDELVATKDPEYMLYSVLYPTLSRSKGSMEIVLSTDYSNNKELDLILARAVKSDSIIKGLV